MASLPRIMLTATLVASVFAAAILPRDANPKKGVPYDDSISISGFDGAISWAYNFRASTSEQGSFEFVPQLLNLQSSTSDVQQAIANGATHVLTYNEPDLAGITPQDAWTHWQQFINDFSGASVGSPAVSNSDAEGEGLDWLRSFVDVAGGADNTKIDFVCLHWYGVDSQSADDQASALMQYVQQASGSVNQIFGRDMPIWLTEFSSEPIDNQAGKASFFGIALPWLDGYDPVERYAGADAVQDGILTSADGTLTQSGQAYVN